MKPQGLKWRRLVIPVCSTPAVPLDLQEVESKIEGFKSFTKRMDENIVVVNTAISEFARKQMTGFKKEYQKVGQSFALLGQAFELDQQTYSAGLNRAIAYTGEAYETVGEYFAEQPRKDLAPISDLLDLYRGHLANFPDIIHVQKGENVFCVNTVSSFCSLFLFAVLQPELFNIPTAPLGLLEWVVSAKHVIDWGRKKGNCRKILARHETDAWRGIRLFTGRSEVKA